MNDFGYYQAILDNLGKVNETQGENITAAATLTAAPTTAGAMETSVFHPIRCCA